MANVMRVFSQLRNVGLGDIVEAVAKPVAVALKMKCLDAQRKLIPGTPCAKRRDALNRVFSKKPEVE
jgi:hypothetical protein